MARPRLVAALLVAVAIPCFAAAPPPSTFATQVTARFASWDRNKDGVLARDEIDALVSDPAVKGEEAAAVVLKTAVRSSRYKLPPLPPSALAALAAEKSPGKDKPDLNAMYSSALVKIRKVNRELFPGGPS